MGKIKKIQLDGVQYDIVDASAVRDPEDKSSGQYLKYNGSTWIADNVDVLPSQSGQSGKYLTTNGTIASWGTVDLNSKVDVDSGYSSFKLGKDSTGIYYIALN